MRDLRNITTELNVNQCLSSSISENVDMSLNVMQVWKGILLRHRPSHFGSHSFSYTSAICCRINTNQISRAIFSFPVVLQGHIILRIVTGIGLEKKKILWNWKQNRDSSKILSRFRPKGTFRVPDTRLLLLILTLSPLALRAKPATTTNVEKNFILTLFSVSLSSEKIILRYTIFPRSVRNTSEISSYPWWYCSVTLVD